MLFKFGRKRGGVLLPDVRKNLGNKCDEFTKLIDVYVSNDAIDLGAEIISAITQDPHRSWNLDENRRTALASLVLSAVPLMLYDISRSEGIVKGGKITAFDVVHWLIKGPAIIEAFPIPKD